MVTLPAMVQVLGLAKEDKGMVTGVDMGPHLDMEMETLETIGRLEGMETVEVMDPPPVIRTNGMEMGKTAGPPDTMTMEERKTTVATKPEAMETVAEDGHPMLETGVMQDGVNETEWPLLYPSYIFVSKYYFKICG